MSNQRLDNYLKTYRKRIGFSQQEVAYLLGSEDGSGNKASQYERSVRMPSLATALACEAVFGVPIRELFAGMYQRAERKIVRRAKTLNVRLAQDKRARSVRKLQRVAVLAGEGVNQPTPER